MLYYIILCYFMLYYIWFYNKINILIPASGNFNTTFKILLIYNINDLI